MLALEGAPCAARRRLGRPSSPHIPRGAAQTTETCWQWDPDPGPLDLRLRLTREVRRRVSVLPGARSGGPRPIMSCIPCWPIAAISRGRRKQGPIQFLENNPTQSSFWVRSMAPRQGEIGFAFQL
jgi:hypothetical protein